jgi:collagen type I alpha
VAPCSVAGTRIRTAHGEVPVEALRQGDLVVTRSGRLAPVAWVGRRTLDLRRHKQPWRAAPVRVAADAIAPGVPSRDLFVSPDHALFLDGVLVPAGRLANGATIARQDGFDTVTYLHVELDRHDVIFAENCPAESFLDTGNRGLFANADAAHVLHPDLSATPDPAALAVWEAEGAAPLVVAGAALDALRARLERRAKTLGWVRAASARPALLAEGGAPLLRALGGGAFRARLRPWCGWLRLDSPSFVPAETVFGSGEPRRLGLAVRAMRLDGVELPESAYGAGWHAAEDGWRWTDGQGEIHLPPREGAATLELLTLPLGQYWRPARRRAMAAAA